MNSICVFCSSGMGNSPGFQTVAEQTGREIARRGLRLIYGGGSIGLMGVTARTVLEAGGEVWGYIPERIHQRVETLKITRLVVVKTMQERKTAMFEAADSFVALPGGIGTLEELLEMYTLLQLGYSRKPVGIINIENFYDSLLTLLDEMTEKGMLKAAHRNMLHEEAAPADLLNRMEHFHAEYYDKW